MSQDMRIAMTTSLNDRLVGPLRRSVQEIERMLRQAQRELQTTQRDSARAGRSLGDMPGPLRAARQAAELARNTQHATAMADRLAQAWNRTGSIVKGVGGGMAAWQAAKFVMSGPMQQSRDYGLSLARAANTAYGDQDEQGWRDGVKNINAMVVDSLRKGGGTRDANLEALNEMLSSGRVNADQARTALPLVSKYSTASGAAPAELAQIVVRALQAGFKEADIARLLDMALVAGQKGGFELKDMATWLPKLMAAGQPSGLRGFEGYARILASAEASLTTAGSRDEAGNNLLNLLGKINSADTAKDAQKLGIDLPGTLSAARGKGMNSLDAFVALVDKIASADPRLATLRQKAATTTGDERKSTLLSQADILEGSAIGKIVQDRQALLALVAELNQRSYIADIMKSMDGARGQVGDSYFSRIASTPAFQVQRQENEKLIAQDRALGEANGALGRFSTELTSLYEKYPGLATTIETAKIVVATLAAAAGAAAGALFLIGGKGGASALGGAAAAAAGGALPAAARWSSLMNGPAISAAAAPAAAGGGAAIAGAIAAPLAVLGAGMYMSDRMNSVTGLTDRINTRNDRLRELQELAAADGRPQRYQGEIAQVEADREAMRERYGAQVGGGRGVVNPSAGRRDDDRIVQAIEQLGQRPVKVILDGREIASQVDEYTTFTARRK